MRDFLDVLDFHRLFGLPHGEFPERPRPDIFAFRLGFLREEVKELEQSYTTNDLVGVVDSLIDLVYVAAGTALFIGCSRYKRGAYWPSFRPRSGFDVPHELPLSLHVHHMRSFQVLVDGLQEIYEDDELSMGADMMVSNLKTLCVEAYTYASMMSVPWEQCWIHVHKANMLKQRASQDGSDSKRGSSFDVVKPKGWLAPDVYIAHELIRSGWECPSHLILNYNTGKVENLNAKAA